MTKPTTALKTISDSKLLAKERNLRLMMREMKSVLVAFSGGVDSSYLALIAHQELSANALCVLGLSPSVSMRQRDEANSVAEKFDLNFETLHTDEMANPDYSSNPTNRCYFCKSELYGKLESMAGEREIDFVIDGSNADDAVDYRPGRQAAVEKQVRSPLVDVGLAKSEIRELSKIHDLQTWDKPASPCLSSRIAYGVPVTIGRLTKVERGEEILHSLGFREFRVRVHDDLARIEISPNEMDKVLDNEITEELAKDFRKIGFRYVTLDLHGYRSGALNEVFERSE